MRNLYDYDCLNNDVFHRGYHILKYLELHKDISPLEKEVISNTILNALVYYKEINVGEQSLDLDQFAIVDDLEHYCYKKEQVAFDFPQDFMAMLRTRTLKASGGTPVSIFLSKPAGSVSFCLYDPCYAISVFFDKWECIDAIYDSPTRVGYRLESSRPFLDIEYNGKHYLVDVLLNRFYDREWFTRKFNMEVKNSVTIDKMTKKGLKQYQEYIGKADNVESSLSTLEMMSGMFDNNGPMAEMNYELEQSKKHFITEWQKINEFNKRFK